MGEANTTETETRDAHFWGAEAFQVARDQAKATAFLFDYVGGAFQPAATPTNLVTLEPRRSGVRTTGPGFGRVASAEEHLMLAAEAARAALIFEKLPGLVRAFNAVPPPCFVDHCAALKAGAEALARKLAPQVVDQAGAAA